MAISSKLEEIILEITRNIGNVHNSLKIGVGDIDTPGSAIFEINNLRSVASTGYPYFGIIESDPLGFIPSYDFNEDQFNVNFSPGTFSYNGSLINTLEQKIPIKKEFLKDYSLISPDSSAYKYGITVGLPFDEASKSIQNISTFTKISTSIGSSLLYVENISDALELGFPINAQVSNYLIKIKSAASTGDTYFLAIDETYYNGAGYGTLPATIPANSTVNFIYTPKLKYITGFPISTSSEKVDDFIYYPALPTSWLPVAKILVKQPDNPRVAGTNKDSYLRTVNDIPTHTSTDLILGDSNDASEVISNCNTAITNLQNYKNNYGLDGFYNAFENYTNTLLQGSNLTINQYWSRQPFRQTQYFSKGLSFSGIERLEFSQNFKEGYYQSRGQDLQHTFGIFRGDLVRYNSGILSTFVIGTSDISGSIITCSSNISSLKSGTQIYGVSAVKTMDGINYVETVPSYKSLLSTTVTNDSYMNELSWTGIAVTDTLFYNVYKRADSLSEKFEKKLTNVDEVLYPPYNTVTTVTDNANFVIKEKLTAISFQSNEDCFIGGLSLKLGHISTGLASTGSSGLYFSIYGDDSGAPDETKLKVENVELLYSDISSGSKEYTIKFPTGINVAENTPLWLLIKKPYDFIVGSGSTSLLMRVDSAQSGFMLTSNSDFNGLTTWTNTGGMPYLKLRNFLDDGNIVGNTVRRGLKLTNEIANTARRLSVYVPPVDDLIDDTGLFFNGSSVAIAATTDKTIKNDLIVTVTAKLGANGIAKSLSTTIPQGTQRDTRFLLGDATDLFDRVTDINVIPGSNLRKTATGPIMWDIYDLITIETEP